MRRNHASDVPARPSALFACALPALFACALTCVVRTTAWHLSREPQGHTGGEDAAAPNLILRVAGTGVHPSIFCPSVCLTD